MKKLEIKNLHVSVGGTPILNGVDLSIKSGETVALLGPNGHGKSTLLNAIMGHPLYKVTEGEILLDDKNLLTMSVDARARLGIFLGMQYPAEIPGVINADFYKSALNARSEKPISVMKLYRQVDLASKKLNIPLDMANRELNNGFSGGEKKRNEILQMLLLSPQLSMLDEIDSGLDVDALQSVAQVIREEQEKGMAFLVISHYERLYSLIKPTKVVVLINGKILITGGMEIVEKTDKLGYEWLRTEYGIDIEKERKQNNVSSLGFCVTKEALTHDSQ
ncbi:MAG: Fe-S cluster assembly ATPase SufC [Bacilli bacterium]|jgi:Fe-S cluster assembly ATP-binding protein|nr:Fe-S cluster assembly ATPase SufC [Bacilli bacterium]MDD3389152.1 Fe-S cluster assembly ATPase SufC [Bacilli bacterium]MDD4344796.1 Fe-S cluster assembly ATPase SufC [Bacilli bacterium]MDD4520880.1 Fe-S cluster assembly ATPase SufC [Bacilli bacterium]MDY0399603.1 Fe-S cluster assembly ATPase SufC [Bacilli bacterium]